VELEKLERKDPVKKFVEKLAVQKNLAGHNVRDGSPNSVYMTSPSKKAI
jgi:hypothetical protein